ncbi:MAG: hypothetical protein EG828_11070 [Deltaproteobacteria bacterium]|nr:hypothetical protein [Deltaproteobacteria bacterium]
MSGIFVLGIFLFITGGSVNLYWFQMVRKRGCYFYPLEKFATWSKLCVIIGESYPHWSGVSIFFPFREATFFSEGRSIFPVCGGTAQKGEAFSFLWRNIQVVIFMLTFDVYVIKINRCLSMIVLEDVSAADGPVFAGHEVPERVLILAVMKFGFSTLSVVKGELTLRIVSSRSGRWSVR